jgi:hypothetical protein
MINVCVPKTPIWQTANPEVRLQAFSRRLEELIQEKPSANEQCFRGLLAFAKQRNIGIDEETGRALLEAWGIPVREMGRFGLPTKKTELPTTPEMPKSGAMPDADFAGLVAAFGLDAEALEERAGILEFEGGLTREAANRRAATSAISLLIQSGEADAPQYDDAFDLLAKILTGRQGRLQPRDGKRTEP